MNFENPWLPQSNRFWCISWHFPTLSHRADLVLGKECPRPQNFPTCGQRWTEVRRQPKEKWRLELLEKKSRAPPSDPEPIIQSQVSQKEKDKYRLSTHGICKDGSGESDFRAAMEVLLHSFHMRARSGPKSPKSGFNSTWTENFQMSKLDLEKAEEPEEKLPHPLDHWKSKGISEKNTYFCFIDYAKASLTMLKPLTVWNTENCGKFFKRWEYQTTWPASSEICMQISRSNS